MLSITYGRSDLTDKMKRSILPGSGNNVDTANMDALSHLTLTKAAGEDCWTEIIQEC